MINNICLEDLFKNNKFDHELDDQVWITVIYVLEQMWRAPIKARFPGENIVVESFDPDDGSTPQLTIYRER